MAGAKQLVSTVHVTDEAGVVHVFGPGAEVPEGIAKLITNPKAWGDEAERVVPAPVVAPATGDGGNAGGGEPINGNGNGGSGDGNAQGGASGDGTGDGAGAGDGNSQGGQSGDGTGDGAGSGETLQKPGSKATRDDWFDYATKGLGLTLAEDATKKVISDAIAEHEAKQAG